MKHWIGYIIFIGFFYSGNKSDSVGDKIMMCKCIVHTVINSLKSIQRTVSTTNNWWFPLHKIYSIRNILTRAFHIGKAIINWRLIPDSSLDRCSVGTCNRHDPPRWRILCVNSMCLNPNATQSLVNYVWWRVHELLGLPWCQLLPIPPETNETVIYV